MPSQALQALREFTGTDGPELAVAVGRMELDQLGDLTEAILDAVAAPPAVAPPRSEVWPLVTLRASTFASGGVYRDAAGPAGLNLNSALNPRLVGTGRFSDGVLRALLYTHGLVIEDPLAVAAEMTQGTGRELREVARLAVAAATSASLEIAPLLDADVVVTFFTTTAQQQSATRMGDEIFSRLSDSDGGIPVDEAWEVFESTYVDGLSPALQKLWRRVRSGDRSPPLQLLEEGIAEGDVEVASTFIKVLSELRPQAVIANAADMVASAVLAVESLGGFFDLLCPSPLFAKLLFVGSPDPGSELRLHELGRVAVPGIHDLAAIDAVRIRQSDEVFAKWRGDLSAALARAHELRVAGRGVTERTEVVREIIADARTALHRQARRSRFFSTSNLVSFVAGALGGAVAGAPGAGRGSGYGAAGDCCPRWSRLRSTPAAFRDSSKGTTSSLKSPEPSTPDASGQG